MIKETFQGLSVALRLSALTQNHGEAAEEMAGRERTLGRPFDAGYEGSNVKEREDQETGIFLA